MKATVSIRTTTDVTRKVEMTFPHYYGYGGDTYSVYVCVLNPDEEISIKHSYRESESYEFGTDRPSFWHSNLREYLSGGELGVTAAGFEKVYSDAMKWIASNFKQHKGEKK